MPLVPTVRTTTTKKDLSKALIQCWRSLYGYTPSKESVGVILAQNMIETGGINFWNWNLGNVKYVKANGNVDYMALKGVWEIINGVRVNLPVSDPGSWFRSFPTLHDGVVFHLNLLKNSRYKSSWLAIEKGDIALFAKLLRANGYYTASEKDYVSGMNRFFAPYIKSNDYEMALQESDSEQDYAHTSPEYSEETYGEHISKFKENFHHGIDEAQQVPQAEIEQKGGNLVAKLMGYLGDFGKWIPRK